MIIDFEGEPARALPERRQKRSPLRDVAGMLRSFAYVSSAAEMLNDQDPPEDFEARAREAFLENYIAHIDPTLLPSGEAAISNLLYCVLALAGKSYPIMAAAVVVEHVAGAMGGIALVALIMALCDARYSAFQYALLSAVALLPRYSLGYPAGWIADHGGWYLYYVASFVIALPGLALVWWNRRPIEALDRRRRDS